MKTVVIHCLVIIRVITQISPYWNSKENLSTNTENNDLKLALLIQCMTALRFSKPLFPLGQS